MPSQSRTQGKKGSKSYVCDHCGATFSYAHHLQRHERTHTGERPYVCEDCGDGFIDSGNLKKHMRVHIDEKPFVCSQCSAAFKRPQDVKSHMRTHSGERPYVCDTCGSAFTSSSVLKVHKRNHTGEKPYVCDICAKAFTQSNHLKQHLRIHTGDKPYECKECSAAFNTCSHLKRHMRLHTGEKPYVCEHCGTSFTHSYSLKVHSKSHMRAKEHEESQADTTQDLPTPNSASNILTVPSQVPGTVCEPQQENLLLPEHSPARSQPGYTEMNSCTSANASHSDSPGKFSCKQAEGCACSSCAVPAYLDLRQQCSENKTSSNPHKFRLCTQENLASLVHIQSEDRPRESAVERSGSVCVQTPFFVPLHEAVSKHTLVDTLRPNSDDLCSQSDPPTPLSEHFQHPTFKSCEQRELNEESHVAITDQKSLHSSDHDKLENPTAVSCSAPQEKTKVLLNSKAQCSDFELTKTCEDGVYVSTRNQKRTVGRKQHRTNSKELQQKPVHKVKNTRTFVCEECAACFFYAHHLRRHMRTHTGEKPYVCEECGDDFAESGNLKKHMRIHTDEKPFVCTQCGADFKRSQNLKRHMRTHTGEKPYICEECGSAFTCSFSLKIHFRGHTGYKPHVCEFCGLAFTSSGPLKKHRRTHTGEQPYICKECGACFSNVNSMRMHVEVHKISEEFFLGETSSCDNRPSASCLA